MIRRRADALQDPEVLEGLRAGGFVVRTESLSAGFS
jgi:hypothetical protein